VVAVFSAIVTEHKLIHCQQTIWLEAEKPRRQALAAQREANPGAIVTGLQEGRIAPLKSSVISRQLRGFVRPGDKAREMHRRSPAAFGANVARFVVRPVRLGARHCKCPELKEQMTWRQPETGWKNSKT